MSFSNSSTARLMSVKVKLKELKTGKCMHRAISGNLYTFIERKLFVNCIGHADYLN